MRHFTESPVRGALAVFLSLLLPLSVGLAQTPAAVPGQGGDLPSTPLLSPEELNNLVAPIALYPDPLLSQALAASTYPLEVAEAGQWLQQNSNLQGSQLMDAARQQNWDPSVQALVAFPDALRLLSNDIRWTTALGNAMLAQQADVMSAVQRMRAQARASGKLATTAQQVVTTATQDGQSAIEIQPANPQVVYVPVYNPAYVWGPPVWGAYPDLWYPGGYGFGFGFGPAIYLGGFFPGWAGWGGWGWGCGWFGSGLFVNAGFFNHWGFRGGWGGWRGGRVFAGRGAWSHDPLHRMGVPYSNRVVANRFGGGNFSRGGIAANQSRGNNFNRGAAGRFTQNRAGENRFSGVQPRSAEPNRGSPNSGSRAAESRGGWSRFGGNSGSNTFNTARSSRQTPSAPGQSFRGSSPAPAFHGGSTYSRSFAPSTSRSFSAPSRNFSAPSRNFSAPSRSFSAPSRSFSAPSRGFSGGHSGFSGGHSGSSGGHSGGGGGGRRR